jgi:YfiR/HmsC-like
LGGALASLLIFSLAGLAFGQSEIELKVKAAFLFNFAKFTQWPPTSLAPADSLVIGCFSDPDFIEVLEATVAGKTVESRHIVVKQVTRVGDLRACHMLFVARSKQDDATALLARAKEMHILTVGESDGFTTHEGIIGFVPLDGSVKFMINLQQAERSGLRLSSKLVGLALNERRGENQR